MMHIVSQRKLIFIYLLLETRLDAFVAETRSDATRGCVCLRSSTAFRCSKCFILAAPKRASAVAFKTQFERSRNAFGTMKKPTWALCRNQPERTFRSRHVRDSFPFSDDSDEI